MAFTKTRPQWGIFLVTTGLTLATVAIYKWRTSRKLDECPLYTIAYSTSVENNRVNYHYSIRAKPYTSYWRINPRSIHEIGSSDLLPKNFISQRFLLRVNCDDPGIHQIDWGHAIPEQYTEGPPVDGWKEIPNEFPKTKFID